MFRSIAALIAAAVVVFWVVTIDLSEPPPIGIGGYSLEQLVVNLGVTYLAFLLCCVVLGHCVWKRRTAQAILSVAAIVLILFLLEVPAGLGLVDYRALLFRGPTRGDGPNFMQRDPELLFRHPPYDRFVQTQGLDPATGRGVPGGGLCEVEYAYDKNGFRNSRDFRQAAVVLIGDSFAEGYLVPHEQICSTELSRILGVDVCNLGHNDYGPAQELVVLRRYGLPLRLRVAVWFFFETNDLFDTEEYEMTVNGWRRLLVRPNSYTSRSFCLNALDRLGYWMEWLRWEQEYLGPKQPVRLLPEIPGDDVTIYFSSYQRELSPVKLARLLAAAQRILLEAKTVCDENKIKFLLVYVPRRFRVYRELCAIPAESGVAQRRQNDLPDRLRRWSQTADVAYLDLTPVLKSAAREGTLVYFTDDGHWCAQGHTVAAEEIAKFIRRAGWLNEE